jgi:hypothetical protein
VRILAVVIDHPQGAVMNRFFRGVPLAIGAGLMLLLAPDALANQAAKGSRPAPGDKEEIAVDVNGATVSVDKNGKLRAPTREEAAALLEAMSKHLDQSTDGLQVRTFPDGTRTVDLQDRFQDVSLAKVQGGKVVTTCVATKAEAKAFLQATGSEAPRTTPARQAAVQLEVK